MLLGCMKKSCSCLQQVYGANKQNGHFPPKVLWARRQWLAIEAKTGGGPH